MPITILFVAANPRTTSQLELAKEASDIEEKLSGASYRDAFIFVTLWTASPDKMIQALNKHRPAIVHFSGHGKGDTGIIFETEGGEEHPVSGGALQKLFEAFRNSVKLVVLNACYSRDQCEQITDIVGCSIGSRAEIADEAARLYSASFYRAVAFGESIGNAHRQGIAALHLGRGRSSIRAAGSRDVAGEPQAPTSPADDVILPPFHRDDIDPDTFCFVTAQEPGGRRQLRPRMGFRRVWIGAAISLAIGLASAALIVWRGSPRSAPGPLVIGPFGVDGGIVVAVDRDGGREERTAWADLCSSLAATGSPECVEMTDLSSHETELHERARAANASLLVVMKNERVMELTVLGANAPAVVARSVPAIHFGRARGSYDQLATVFHELSRVGAGLEPHDDDRLAKIDPDIVGSEMATVAILFKAMRRPPRVASTDREVLRRYAASCRVAEPVCALAHYLFVTTARVPGVDEEIRCEVASRLYSADHLARPLRDLVPLAWAEACCSQNPTAVVAFLSERVTDRQPTCNTLWLPAIAACLAATSEKPGAPRVPAWIQELADSVDIDQAGVCEATTRASAHDRRATVHLLAGHWGSATRDYQRAWSFERRPTYLLSWVEALLLAGEKLGEAERELRALLQEDVHRSHWVQAAYLLWLSTRRPGEAKLLLSIYAAVPDGERGISHDAFLTLRRLACRPSTECEYDVLAVEKQADSTTALERLLEEADSK